jgi:hypothetical protein
MATLTKDMKTLSDKTVAHEVSLKERFYHGIVSFDDQYEFWETYV